MCSSSGKIVRWFTCIWILLAVADMHAQLEPLTDQYLLNTLAINPAYAGARDALSISLLHRNQWTGFDGAPRTETLALHAPMRGEKVGLGLLAMSDRAGVANTSAVSGNFAYRIPTGKGIMSLGLGGGISFAQNRWSDLVALDPDDNLLPATSEGYILPDFSLGLYYNSETFFFGFSLPMFLSHKFDPVNQRFNLENNINEYNFFFNSGTLLTLSSRWKLLPSVLIRFKPVSPPQADLNAYVIYNDRIWMGISYRTNKSLIGLFMYQVNEQLAVAYSYDLGLGKTGRYLGGAHEIMIRYDFRYIIDVLNPRYF
jgi:type IX secretion system PorP/SprF family membrane protein